jgi:dTDP-4-dehydrorhamnose reductase
MKKLLITGASGFLGWNLCQIARSAWEVHGSYFQHPIEISSVDLPSLAKPILWSIDLTDLDAVKYAIDTIAPDAVIHTAAASSPNFCQANPDKSYQINVTASQKLAQLCCDANIPFVFTSTDLVFDGTKAPYQETDPVAPINLYGEQKIAAEREILAVYPRASICRMPLMFGIAPPNATSFIQPWIKALRSGENLKLFVDEFRTPVSAMTAAAGLLLALRVAPGTINLGGKERLSRYEFGLLLAEVFGFDRSLILPIYQKDLQMIAPRAADVSLDINKAIELGYNLPSLRSELEAIEKIYNFSKL